MTIRNLDLAFRPRSVALFGASKDAGTAGAALTHNLFTSGFQGPIMPVSRRYRAVEGHLAYPDVESLPVDPDLAVILSPADDVPALIDAAGTRGAKAVVVISNEDGERRPPVPAGGASPFHDAIRAAGRRHRMRIIGPDSLGIMTPTVGLNASFAHVQAKPGHLAFVTESGTILTSVLDWATARGIGFSHLMSLGDVLDVDFGDTLDYLAAQPEVRGILLYLESISNARKFMSAARAAARVKPVIVIKSGRYPASARALSAHSGMKAGFDPAYDAAIQRAGMLRVRDFGDLFGAVETLAVGRPAQGHRLSILTNGGGVGIMTVDALIEHGGQLADLSAETISQLHTILPVAWSRSNPVDILGTASAERYARALEILLKDKSTDAALVLHCPTSIASSRTIARAVVDTARECGGCVLTCWLGEEAPTEAREHFAAHNIPTYFTPERAVRAFMDMVHYRRNQEALTETPPSVPEDFEPDAPAAAAIIAKALADNRDWLTEPETKAVLAAYAIPVAATRIARSPKEAAREAAALAGPVALKILSPDIVRKTEVGGVTLDLRSPAAVADAAELMARRVAERRPTARIDGFVVQPMIDRPDAFELLVSVFEDPDFGPMIRFGQGGAAAEIIDDTTVALPPLNMRLARDTIARTRVNDLLRGYGHRSAVAIDDVCLVLIKVAQIVIDIAELVELRINPLLVDEYGVIALDARMRIARATMSPARRLAIRPYPKELEETLHLSDGREFVIRPILPEDEPPFHDLFSRLSPEDIRLRFFASKNALSHATAARMTQIDYDREMTLVLADPGLPGTVPVHGLVQAASDPDGERAEYAILLEGTLGGHGLGRILMERIIAFARSQGVREMFGEVLRENRRMLHLCDTLGFRRHISEEDPSIVEVRLPLHTDSDPSPSPSVKAAPSPAN